MPYSQRDFRHYSVMHDMFSADYREVNKYVLELYNRPKQFMDETSAPLSRFLREYTIPGMPRQAEVPTRTVLDFISQIDDFAAETVGLFDEHKNHVTMCDQYMKKVALLKESEQSAVEEELRLNFMELAPELVHIQQDLKKIKLKADTMLQRLQNLQNRWDGMKEVLKA
jgi:hypothetical protein